MNNELTKKLKDAGFPSMQNYVDAPDIIWALLAPSLSQLIEACGKPFGLLTSVYGVWIASIPKMTAQEIILEGMSSDSIQGEGETPEIAVANLWLKLKIKNGIIKI